MKTAVRIYSLASALPETVRTSNELEQIISTDSPNILLPHGIIETLTGVKERRVLAAHLNASDLAVEAAQKALSNSSLQPSDIDCLIFAAADGDVMEPATANIVQTKLGLHCPAFDLKNACNSFLSAMEVAEALIVSGKYKHILIANGEVPSRSIRTAINDKAQLKRSFAAFTLGDAGCAMILGPSDRKRGIVYSQFSTYGEHWPLSVILGGGTLYPHDIDKTYFEGETAGLKDVFSAIGPDQIYQTLEKVGWTLSDLDRIVIHQVSMKTFDLLVEQASLPQDKLAIVLPELGNMISASIPVALDSCQQNNGLKPGDKILLIGLASGVSFGTMAIIW